MSGDKGKMTEEKGLMRQIWDGDITSADKDSLTKEQKAMIEAVVMLMERSAEKTASKER